MFRRRNYFVWSYFSFIYQLLLQGSWVNKKRYSIVFMATRQKCSASPHWFWYQLQRSNLLDPNNLTSNKKIVLISIVTIRSASNNKLRWPRLFPERRVTPPTALSSPTSRIWITYGRILFLFFFYIDENITLEA